MNKYHEIPKSLEECVVPDKTSQNLYSWAQRLEKWGMILFWVILAAGIIPALLSISKGQDFSIFVAQVLDTIIYAFIEYCVYHVLSLLISSLASIVKNTKITAKTTLYTASMQYPQSVTKETITENNEDFSLKTQIPKNATPPKHKWRCSGCGNMISQTPCPHCNS